MPTNSYDVLTMGDDLAGLVAATLCARRGLRVLITQVPGATGAEQKVGPYRLPREPLVMVGDQQPAIRRVLAELGFSQSIKRRLTPLRPGFQILLPDARLDLSADAEATGRELARELPAERAALEQAFATAAEVTQLTDGALGADVTVPPGGFWERRELARLEPRLEAITDLLPGVPDGHQARALLALPGAFTLGCDPRSASPVALLRAFELWRKGGHLIEGGEATLRDMLLDKLRTQHAGEQRTALVSSVTTRWGKVSGVTLRDRGEDIGANHLLVAAPLVELGDLFGDKRPKKLAQRARYLVPTAYRYVLHLLVDTNGVPEGLGPVAFAVFDPAQPLIGDNALAIYREELGGGVTRLSVVANCPAPGDGQNLEDLMAQLRPRLRARIEALLPFSGEHLIAVHSPNQPRVPEGLEVSSAPPACPMRPLWSANPAAEGSSEELGALGLGGLGYETGIGRAVLTTTQNLPGLGLEGDFAAGWCAAKLVSTAAGAKKDYLKDEVLTGTGS